ncbi:hypothetical protein [Desulfogranum mediterraneum]|uniref:hypothetical protein n=1 Tax=Desulfogranum mediterraneum TaxID=160661 RepID=UPI00048EB878|nr:hypothetical protein [Desulfogranum mediterraneum]
MSVDIPDLGLTADILKGKQSVRATFKLPARMIKVLSIAAAQLGIKQKTLFDQLVEDREVLAQVAVEAEKYRPVEVTRHQKTYVLSRNSLVSLEQVARAHQMPRDVLVEVSISRLLPIISAEREKQHRRARVLAELEQYHRDGISLLQKTGQLLGARDPFFTSLEGQLEQAHRTLQGLRAIVERGKSLDEL